MKKAIYIVTGEEVSILRDLGQDCRILTNEGEVMTVSNKKLTKRDVKDSSK